MLIFFKHFQSICYFDFKNFNTYVCDKESAAKILLILLIYAKNYSQFILFFFSDFNHIQKV